MSAKTTKNAYKRIYDYEFAFENPDDRFSARRYSGLPSKHGETVPVFNLKSFETGAIAYIEAGSALETLHCDGYKVRGCWIHTADRLNIRMIYIEGIRPDQIDKAADVIIDNLLTAKAAMRKTA